MGSHVTHARRIVGEDLGLRPRSVRSHTSCARMRPRFARTDLIVGSARPSASLTETLAFGSLRAAEGGSV